MANAYCTFRFYISLLLIAQSAILSCGVALAQNAAKPIKIVVPFAPGGAQDIIGRYFASQLSERTGSAVIVENRAGAGGTIAADYVAKSPPDGNTLFLATGGAISIAPHLTQKLPYDAQLDFSPVAMVADTPIVLAVRSDSKWKTLSDLIKTANDQPDVVTFASTGNGTVSHLTGELFQQAAHIKLTHIPYRGAAPAIIDLVGGQVAAMVTTTTSIEPMVKAEKVRILATFSAGLLPAFPNVPTLYQAIGVSGLEVPVWVGLMAPKKTPAIVLQRLSAELLAICRLPQTQQRLLDAGAQPSCASAAEFNSVITQDTMRWQRVIRAGNIKVE